MATGPWHYSEAEHLIERANHVGHNDPRRGDGFIAAAQVHATLALAAATALQAALPLIGDDQQVTEWGRAVGTTVDTNQGARITNALLLVEEMYEQGLIVDGIEKLRAALGATGGDR